MPDRRVSHAVRNLSIMRKVSFGREVASNTDGATVTQVGATVTQVGATVTQAGAAGTLVGATVTQVHFVLMPRLCLILS